MIELSLITGIGIVCFLLLYFAFNLKEEHFLMQLLALFFFVFLMFLIPKAALDYNDNCELVLNRTDETFQYGDNFTGYHWDYRGTSAPAIPNDAYLFHKNTTYKYTWFCAPNTRTTASTFYQVVTWFVRMFALYVLVYLIWYSFRWINNVVRGKKEE